MSDLFRSMLFTALQEDDPAGKLFGVVGLAGRFVDGQHSLTRALDLQLCDASRDVGTEEQVDVSISCTLTL